VDPTTRPSSSHFSPPSHPSHPSISLSLPSLRHSLSCSLPFIQSLSLSLSLSPLLSLCIIIHPSVPRCGFDFIALRLSTPVMRRALPRRCHRIHGDGQSDGRGPPRLSMTLSNSLSLSLSLSLSP